MDATEPLDHPLADGAEHGVVVGKGVVAELPVLPKGGRAVLEHPAPAWKVGLGSDSVGNVGVTFLG